MVTESERRRARLGIGLLVGTILAFLAALWVLPALGSATGFVLGPVLAMPVFLLLLPSLPARRALALAVLTASATMVVLGLLSFGVCVATGCVG